MKKNEKTYFGVFMHPEAVRPESRLCALSPPLSINAPPLRVFQTDYKQHRIERSYNKTLEIEMATTLIFIFEMFSFERVHHYLSHITAFSLLFQLFFIFLEH